MLHIAAKVDFFDHFGGSILCELVYLPNKGVSAANL